MRKRKQAHSRAFGPFQLFSIFQRTLSLLALGKRSCCVWKSASAAGVVGQESLAEKAETRTTNLNQAFHVTLYYVIKIMYFELCNKIIRGDNKVKVQTAKAHDPCQLRPRFGRPSRKLRLHAPRQCRLPVAAHLCFLSLPCCLALRKPGPGFIGKPCPT